MNRAKIVVIAGAVAMIAACGQSQRTIKEKDNADTTSVAASNGAFPSASVPVEDIDPTPDQQARRTASEKICAAHGIPVYKNPRALFAMPEKEVSLRSKDEVVDRAIALCFMELKSEQPAKEVLDEFSRHYRVMEKLSDKETIFVTSQSPTSQEMMDANWRAEGAHVMLWALGYIDSLSYPSTPCNVAEDVHHIISTSEADFRNKAKLRSKKEILDQADLILRYEWACVDARLSNAPMPGDLISDVVMERHYALNWLIRYLNQDWDNVSTDS
ncbi:DUF4272 domain-containing protein [Chitinophaga polysaccharea]|uniref:DUF4272 domain-containing protein n=1 Tax=Chitinophaga polysaccharea TaxID=1293035 RepID=UPI0014550604|nr:DUF4272 domain-containing protein [Chitinophaga polysaccharea]NLR57807.1 DUF4272 domain-containing protein [Chitinophaga polysaccharea]